MAVLYPTSLLALFAFCLGACPFSVWIGKWALGKDIRNYGDGNPGSFNVFRAGGHKSGFLAVLLDVAKGVPFVLLAHSFFGLPEIAVVIVAVSAILGHAYSPLLRFRGGKSIATTMGVLLALPQHEILIMFLVFMLVGFLLLEVDAWAVILGPTGSLAYLVTSGAKTWEPLFVLSVLAIFAVKHFDDLHTIPRPKARFLGWLQSRRRQT